MRDILRELHPDVVSISSEVLREYREYERSMTTLVDAAVKPKLSRYIASIQQQLHAYVSEDVLFYVMKSNGGCCLLTRSCTSRSRPCCPPCRRCARCRADRRRRRLRPRTHVRRRRHVHRRHGRRRRRADTHHRGQRRCLPQQDPHDRRRHGWRG